MKPKHRLTQLLLFLLSGVSLASVILVSVMWINYQKSQSAAESRRISSEYYTNWEKSISLETQRMCDYIENRTSDGQIKFYLSIKSQVEEIWNMLNSQNLQKAGEAKSLVLSILGEMKDSKDRPRYLILDRDGRLLSRPGQEDIFKEDPEVQAIIKSVLDLGEAFYSFDFNQTWTEAEEKPVVYLKVFEPFGWIIGAENLFSEYQTDIKTELVSWADNVPLPIENSLLIVDYSGQILSYTDKELEGRNLFESDNGTLLTQAAARIIRGARFAKHNFLRFPLKNPETGEIREAAGYYRAVEAWKWVVVIFIDSGSLDEALAEEQKTLAENVRRQIVHVVTIFTVMLVVIAVISHIISRKASKSFQDFFRFFENAATSATELDPEAQPFSEFMLLAQAANRMIAQSREASELMAASEAKFRTVFDVSPQLITVTDREGTLVEANEEFAVFVGQKLCQVIGSGMEHCFHFDKAVRDRLRAEVAGGGLVRNREVVIPNLAGSPVTFLFSCKGFRVGGEYYFLSIFVDITALKDAENEKMLLQEKLSRSQKMEAMGLMAAQVAHELNNILSGLVGYPQLLLRDKNLSRTQRDLLGEIMDSGKRSAAVVSDLLTLSRGLATTRMPVDFNDLIHQVLNSPENQDTLKTQKEPVRLLIQLDPSDLEVSGSTVHLKKVIANITQNAIEAAGTARPPLGGSPPGEVQGEVIVSTQSVRLDEPKEGLENFRAGEYVLFSVRDNGPGISPEEMGRIFEPFYSRKTGSGLGLAVVSIIVREHGGAVELDSSSAGTDFRVFLPRLEGRKKPKTPILEDYRGHGQKVLVVDDVDIQRKLAQKMLKTLGYEAHSVASGEEAVEYLKTHEADLVVLDMIMNPGWNGRETYEAILAIKPGQKAIIASGMAENEEVEKAQALGAKYFVSKPYTLEDIAGAVHSAILGQ
ncbi:MAG: cache domain-containing protein [Deltaproteobacteria bacterium]|nr:cache domain-containing protein [Deltaproteobacteria bacterium]